MLYSEQAMSRHPQYDRGKADRPVATANDKGSYRRYQCLPREVEEPLQSAAYAIVSA